MNINDPLSLKQLLIFYFVMGFAKFVVRIGFKLIQEFRKSPFQRYFESQGLIKK